jgi:hypothetical protein
MVDGWMVAVCMLMAMGDDGGWGVMFAGLFAVP